MIPSSTANHTNRAHPVYVFGLVNSDVTVYVCLHAHVPATRAVFCMCLV